MQRYRIRAYADTSVFGGAFDEEFAEATSTFLRQVREGRLDLVTSLVVRGELEDAPPAVRSLFAELTAGAEVVRTSPEARTLHDAYLEARVVSQRWSTDALHVALATVTGCHAIVSWNFKHIVHLRRIRAYNAVNAVMGYPPIAVHSPLEVVEHEEEDA